MLRIAAGKYKNRQLKVLKEVSRPFTERMRVSVFDLLNEFINGANVIDLYAGSGAVGIEALSRGAGSATFVENDKKAFFIIKENIKNLKVEEETEIYNLPVNEFLKNNRRTYDLIFLDPPFTRFRDKKSKLNISDVINICHKDSIVILRIEKETYKKIDTGNNFREAYIKNFGKSQVIFYYPEI